MMTIEPVKQPLAFPVVVPETFKIAYYGITLRDYFAGQSLPAVIEAISAARHTVDLKDGETLSQAIARDSYALADAMISARLKGDE